MSWVNRAARERLAKQLRRGDTQYTHRWTVKDSGYAKTPTMAKDDQALANTRGQKLHRSADEPAAAPIFSPTEIHFNAPESGDNFRYPHWNKNEKTDYGSRNTDMLNQQRR